MQFIERPKDGVTIADPDGVYYFVNEKGRAQIICIGAMPLSPKELSTALGNQLGHSYVVERVGVLEAEADAIREVLDRGFIDIWLRTKHTTQH